MAHHADFSAEPAMKKMRVHANELRQPLDSFQRQSRFPMSSHPVNNSGIHERQHYSGFQRNYPPREMDHKYHQQVGRHPRDATPYSVAPSAALHQSFRPRGGLPGMSSLLQSSGSPQPPRRPLESGPIPPHLHRWSSARSSPPPADVAGSRHPRHSWGVDHSSSSPYYHHDPLPSSAASSALPSSLKRSPSSSTASTSEDDEAASVVTAKSSRYLREMDRRAILDRLANGEKQATLAKEYQVSRAAICNLNKHREEVMSRADENPFAKHPKKRKLRTAAASSSASPTASTQTEPTSPTVVTPSDSMRSSSPGAEGSSSSTSPTPTVHVVKSRAVQLLLTSLRSPSTASAEFRRGSERLMRLALEDALALVPCKTVEVALNDQVKVEGVVRRHPPCAISMEQVHCPMMDLFHLLEPDHPTGYARVTSSSSPSPSSSSGSETGSGAERVHLLAAHVPPTLRYHNVFLLDLVATRGEVVCESIQRLLQRGAVEERIHLVALFVSSEVVAMVQCKFPRVQLVTTQIDSGLNNRRPSSSSSSSSSSSAASSGRSTLDGVLQRLHDMYQQPTQSEERAPSSPATC